MVEIKEVTGTESTPDALSRTQYPQPSRNRRAVSPGGRVAPDAGSFLWMKGKSIMNKIMHYCVCILLVNALTSCASAPVAPIEDRSMQKVHDIDLTKNEIYDLSLEWMAAMLSDSRGVFELIDKDKGKIIGTGQTFFIKNSFWGMENVPCRFTVMVEVKDNKYKTIYNNFIGLSGKSYGRLKPVEEKEYIDFVKSLILKYNTLQ